MTPPKVEAKKVDTETKKTAIAKKDITEYTCQVAWAEAHPEICTDVFGRIRTNIEGRGFKCTDGPLATAKRETANNN